MTVKKIKVGTTTHDIQAGSADKLNTNAGSTTSPIYFANGVPVECTYDLNKTVPSNAVFTDTKNTAGSTNSSSKLFLIGATSQAANPQTYSHDTAYVGTDGYLYSNSTKVNPRIYATLVPEGTAIPANADLNTVTYLKVGNYYCSANATAKTLKNCPLTTYGSDGVGTSGSAFMMQVYSPLAQTFDDETTGTWRYRIRKITHYNTAIEYTQYCYVGGTAGAANWVYGAWYVTPRSAFTFNKTSASTAAVGSATNPVYIDSTGTFQKTTYTLGKSVPSDAKFTDTVYTHPTYTARTGKPTANQTPAFGGTATVSQITSDGTGHVTAATDRTITIPSTLSNGTGTAGLIKTSSTITDVSAGYNACPVINGVPYYGDTHLVQQNKSTSSVSSPILLGAGPDGIRTITTFSNGVTVTPSTNTITATTFSGTATNANKVNTNLIIKLNSGTTEGTNLFTFNGSAAKTVNITPSAIGAAASSHGNHVPATQTANNAKFLRNDNTWQTVTPANIGASASGHTHSYLPLSGGTMTGTITMPNATPIMATTTSGEIKPLIYLSNNVEDGVEKNNLTLGNPAAGNPLNGGIRLYAPNDSITLTSNGGTLQWYYYSNTSLGTTAIFNTSKDAKAMLGSTNYRWYRLYQSASSVSTSDEREKSDIMSIADYPVTYSRDGSGNIFEKLFNKLQPKTYTLNIENSGNLHIGFIAQDIVSSMEELGLSEDDLGFVIHDYWTDEETGEEKDRYGLAYEEFMALNTYMIQKQQNKIETQESIIERQQIEINDLKERITKLEELLLNK